MKNYLINQFDLHHRLYNNVLDGFTDQETNQRLQEDKKINPVKYLAGHLLNAQYGIGMVAGVKFRVKWNELFAAAGQSKAEDDIDYPDIEEIKAEWNRIHPSIRNGLQELAPKILTSEPPKPLDRIWDTVGGQWAFLNHHQAYHIGQIGILRRGFDKAPMSYD